MTDLTRARVSIPQLAELLDISRAWAGRLQREGVLPRTLNGTVQLGASLRRYVKHISRPTVDGRAALVEEQVRKLRMENDQTETNVVDTGNVETLAAQMITILNGEIAGFEDRVPPAARAAMAREVDASRQRIKSGMAAALRDALTGGDDETDETA